MQEKKRYRSSGGLVLLVCLIGFFIALFTSYILENQRLFGRWYPPELKNCRVGSTGWSLVDVKSYHEHEWPIIPSERWAGKEERERFLQNPPIWRGLRFTVLQWKFDPVYDDNGNRVPYQYDKYVVVRLEEGPWKGRILPFTSYGGGCYE